LIRGLQAQGKEAGCEGQDLLQEALLRTFAGDRRWNCVVPFDCYLKGVIKSLAYNCHSADALQHRSHTQQTEAEAESSCLDQAASVAPNVECQLEAIERLQHIRTLLKDDPIAMAVLDSWNKGMTGPEIQKSMGLSNSAYDTTRKRIRRKADPWRPQN
jgi:DNA-directed RNA polymerase specialized sigma24 family protein